MPRVNRTAAARRQQYARANAKAIQVLLRNFQALQHRGCQTSKLGHALNVALSHNQPTLTKQNIPPPAPPPIDLPDTPNELYDPAIIAYGSLAPFTGRSFSLNPDAPAFVPAAASPFALLEVQCPKCGMIQGAEQDVCEWCFGLADVIVSSCTNCNDEISGTTSLQKSSSVFSMCLDVLLNQSWLHLAKAFIGLRVVIYCLVLQLADGIMALFTWKPGNILWNFATQLIGYIALLFDTCSPWNLAYKLVGKRKLYDIRNCYYRRRRLLKQQLGPWNVRRKIGTLIAIEAAILCKIFGLNLHKLFGAVLTLVKLMGTAFVSQPLMLGTVFAVGCLHWRSLNIPSNSSGQQEAVDGDTTDTPNGQHGNAAEHDDKYKTAFGWVSKNEYKKKMGRK